MAVPRSIHGNLPLSDPAIFAIAERIVDEDHCVGPKTLEWWLAHEMLELAAALECYKTGWGVKCKDLRELKSSLEYTD